MNINAIVPYLCSRLGMGMILSRIVLKQPAKHNSFQHYAFRKVPIRIHMLFLDQTHSAENSNGRTNHEVLYSSYENITHGI